MKTKYGVALIFLAVLAVGCAQKVNDPADVQAIKDLSTAWDKAWNDGNAEALASTHTPDAVSMEPNQPALRGKDAIRASCRRYFDEFRDENRSLVEDVRVSGDLAVARGTQETKSRLKAGGYSVRDKSKWITAFQRQPDGSWKAFWDIYNSDLPVGDALPLGPEELTLLQLERDCSEAVVKKDAAALDRILAADFVAHDSSGVRNKKQAISALTSAAIKVESGVLSDMKAIVLGDTAVVHGLWTEKSTSGGKDTSGRHRWTDTFVKLDGRWQCVGSYSTKAE